MYSLLCLSFIPFIYLPIKSYSLAFFSFTPVTLKIGKLYTGVSLNQEKASDYLLNRFTDAYSHTPSLWATVILQYLGQCHFM